MMKSGLTGFPNVQTQTVEAVSGKMARSRLKERKVDHLEIVRLEKEGYRASARNQRQFIYAQSPEVFRPDRNNPVEFTMLPAQDFTKLKSFSARLGIAPDGNVISVDPKTGQNDTGGISEDRCVVG